MLGEIIGMLSGNSARHAQAENSYDQPKGDGLNPHRDNQISPAEARMMRFGQYASFSNRMATTTLERFMSACRLDIPQNWKMRPGRRLQDLKNVKSRETVMDAARRWFRANNISMRGVTDEGVFESFSTAMNGELGLTSSKHGVSRQWFDFLRPDLPSLSAYLSVGRQLKWERALMNHLNRLRGKKRNGKAKRESVWGGRGRSATPLIDLILSDSSADGKRLIRAFSRGRPVDDIDKEDLQAAATFADENVLALDGSGLAETDLTEEGSEQALVQKLKGIAAKFGAAYKDAIENWKPYYDENGNILVSDPLTRVAQLSQSWEFDEQTGALTVNPTSQLSNQDAQDQFLMQLIVDADKKWQDISPTDIIDNAVTPAFNMPGAYFDSMYAVDNDLFYMILEYQLTQESIAAFNVAKQSWEASAPMLESYRQQLIEQGRATDLLDERLELYNKALQTAYFNMMLCIMHFGPVNLLRQSTLQPHYMPVEDFYMGMYMNTVVGKFIMDDEYALWEDEYWRE